ncbi:hypothetical protein [Dysgonomonas sp. 520]|uniref:hypothetical protein n=1 Tax=Dysgonomonas sp. 520 TaxID=2302931 RepID=UPI0013D68BDF|nr:hypothetical protein [Dysgonomonas sp. 520]NDW08176.1 hypothetical protein [Dysgonomonas sp. 520]
MLSHLLLSILVGLLTLVALGFTIGGLVKKNQKLWIISLVVFIALTLLSVFCIYKTVVAAIDYAGSEQFQQDAKNTAEKLSNTVGGVVSGAAQGLGNALDDEAIEKLAAKGGKILGKGIKATATSLDETIGQTTVFTDESINKEGIIIGRAEQTKSSSKYAIGLFLEFKNDFKDKLILTSYDSQGNKQDISELNIDEKAGTSKVLIFQFDHFHPGVSGYCILTK